MAEIQNKTHQHIAALGNILLILYLVGTSTKYVWSITIEFSKELK